MEIGGSNKIRRGENFARWREVLPEVADPRLHLSLLVIEEMDEDAVVTLDHLFDLCADMEMDCGGVEEAIAMILERRARGEKVLDLVERVYED